MGRTPMGVTACGALVRAGSRSTSEKSMVAMMSSGTSAGTVTGAWSGSPAQASASASPHASGAEVQGISHTSDTVPPVSVAAGLAGAFCGASAPDVVSISSLMATSSVHRVVDGRSASARVGFTRRGRWRAEGCVGFAAWCAACGASGHLLGFFGTTTIPVRARA